MGLLGMLPGHRQAQFSEPVDVESLAQLRRLLSQPVVDGLLCLGNHRLDRPEGVVQIEADGMDGAVCRAQWRLPPCIDTV